MSDLGFNPPADSTPVGAPTSAAEPVTTVADGRDLTGWEKVKAGLEPVRVAEVVRSVLLVASILGFISAADVDAVTNAVVGVVGSVLLIVSVGMSIFARRRVTPTNKLDGGTH